MLLSQLRIRLHRARQHLTVDVGEHDIEPGERADMADALPHLSGADNADALKLGHLRPLLLEASRSALRAPCDDNG